MVFNLKLKNKKEILTKGINANIIKLYISSMFYNILFDRAIWIIYLIERGQNTFQVGLVESLLHLSIFIFEIPTGLIADIYGRRISLIYSRIIIIVYAVGMIFSGKFYFFSILFILMGMGSTFNSGADIALLYDSLKLKGKNKNKIFIKINGFYGSFMTFGMALGLFMGGILKLVSWEFLYLSLAVVQVISIIPLIKFDEIRSAKCNNNALFNKFFSNIKVILSNTKKTFNNRIFLMLSIGIIFFIASTNTLYLFIPLWFKQLGYSEFIISNVFAIDSIISIFTYSVVHKIEGRININKLIIFPPFISSLFLASITFVPDIFAFIFFVIISNMMVFFYPLSNTLINKKIGSKERATVLSSISFMGSLFMMFAFPLIGHLAEYISVGIILSFLSIFSMSSVLLIILSNNLSRLSRLKTNHD